jgi:carbonic anhydrase
MLLRIPHVARAGRRISTTPRPGAAVALLSSSALPVATARPFSLSWKPKLRMASEDPEKQQEVRKYLQQSHDRIFENNKKWADEMKAKKPEFFSDLTAGQAPEYLWIGELYFPLHTNPPQTHTQCSSF